MAFEFDRAVFDAKKFLAHDWQRQPRVFRRVFADFADPISADELAGIGLEPGVDSRLVSNADDQWQLTHGPIEDFSTVGDSHWSLLVQAVNEHFPPAQALLEPFRFIPDWRIDDLMVSYSTPGGGVGAHLDQYDVFIIQGQGQRRWQVGARGDYKVHTPHPELKQIEDFVADIDVVLNPGDMIYIPAGFPHAGESITECLNYSVGFRAPSQAEMLSALADHALDQELLATRYQDANEILDSDQPSWHLSDKQMAHFRQFIRSGLEDDQLLNTVIANMLSQNPRPPLLIWPQREVTESGLIRYLQQYATLQRAVGLRMITAKLDGQLTGLVQAQQWPLDESSQLLFETLVNTPLEISCQTLLPLLKSGSARQLMLDLLNEGFWFVGDDDA